MFILFNWLRLSNKLLLNLQQYNIIIKINNKIEMKNFMKSPTKYWYKRHSSIINKTQAENDSNVDSISIPNITQKPQIQRIVMIQNESLKNQNNSITQQLFKIAYKLQKIRGFNSSYNQKFIDLNNQIIELKCPQHSSVIILYCKTDLRLLCANCAFGNQLHKRHAMIQAAKGTDNIETRLKELQKMLRGSTNRLQIQKAKWQQLLVDAESTKKAAMHQIQKAHDSAVSIISDIFAKCKAKIQDMHRSTTNTINTTLQSFNSIIKSLKYENPLCTIKHLYLQYAIQQIDIIERTIPNISIGSNMIRALSKISKINVKYFKSLVNKIKTG